MAISRKRKNELIDQYVDWLKQSQAVIMADYCGQPTKSIYQLRTKVRANQGEFHVVKNTLMLRALRQMGMPAADTLLDGPVAMTFCYEDPPAMAKALIQFEKEAEKFSIKGGVLGNRIIDADGVKALAALPPYPVMMAQVLGTIQAPAGKLAGVINAGLRQVATVVQARVDQLKALEGEAA